MEKNKKARLGCGKDMSVKSNVFIYTLKNNKFFRLAIKPLMDVYRLNRNRRYYRSDDSKILQRLKNEHREKRCFIIGNGPSLTIEDLDKLGNEITFASNRIFNIFEKTGWRPTYYLAVDSDLIKYNYETIKSIQAEYIFLSNIYQIPPNDKSENIVYINEFAKFPVNKWNDVSAFVSEDVAKFFSIGYTVTFTAIQLALYMGFKEIYLLGVDFSYSIVRDSKGRITKNDNIKDYFDGKKYHSTVLNYNSVLHAYEVAEQYCRNHNVKIYNATRGGKLEVFKRVSFDELQLI